MSAEIAMQSLRKENSPPNVTAIIPTYQRARLLRRAVCSVLDQEGVPLQVCVYDNASGDETAAEVKAMASRDARLVYHCHPSNLGAAANFEFGLRRVDTPFFSILSDDDYLLPDFYRRAMAGFEAYPEAKFWIGTTLNVDEKGIIWDARVNRWPREGLFRPPGGFMAMTGQGFQPTWTGMVFRREVLDLEGLPDPETLGPSDMEFCLRLAARFPYVMEKHPSAVFVLNSESFSTTQPLSSFWPGWKRMMRNFEASELLSGDAKNAALSALRADAQRMLFRRGANAIAARRLDFARQAAQALAAECKLPGRAAVLRTIAGLCAQSRVAQQAYTALYTRAERRLVQSRNDLQVRYGHLLRDA